MGVDETAAEVLTQVASQACLDAGGVDPKYLGGYLPGLVAAVGAGERLDRGQVRACRLMGERAAGDGVALRAVLDLYLSAGRRLWKLLPVVEEASTDPAGVVAAGQVMLWAAEDVAGALAGGYQAARRRMVREQESARRELIDDLLAGRGQVSGMAERAAGFGLELAGPHAVAVAEAATAFVDRTPVMGMLERAVQEQVPEAGALVAGKNGRLVVIFAAPVPETMDRVAQTLAETLTPATPDAGVDLRRHADLGSWRIAVGRAQPGTAGVRASYEEAGTGLDLADHLDLPDRVVHAKDLLVYRVLLRDRAAITDLIDSVLAPLHAARGGAGPLVRTLTAYYDAGGNAAQAARSMHLSVRALTYRLQRVGELTGYNPMSTRGRFTMHAAVLGAKLLDWPTTPLDR